MQLSNKDKKYIETYSHLSLSFEDFKAMAKNESLSLSEKIGFPEAYRDGLESIILEDISNKIKSLNKYQKNILDIGSGCSGLTTEENNHKLILCDSQEMLDLITDEECVNKISGKFPYNLNRFSHLTNSLDGIIVYSVLQHIILEDSIFNFIDSSLELLKPGGEMLIGDIPNISKRERFFRSETGIKYHQNFTKSNSLPEDTSGTLKKNKIDDSIIFSILQRYRNSNYETYLLSQDSRLPMSNRREDILIVKN
jgi:2-polyprenyl-3-methyl-5-hydroxy-6-metoxy-1,4-benzoquinol methylase